MQRTNIIELKPSKRQAKILRECMLLSSCVYNMTNYEVRQAIFSKAKVPAFFALQQKIQHKDDYRMLGRSYALPRIQIYAETNSARFKLIQSKTQEYVGLPKYLKNRKTNTTLPSYLVIDGCQYSLDGRRATIPLSHPMRKKHSIKHFCIAYNGLPKWSGKQQRGQIHEKDGKFYLYQSVEVAEPRQSIGRVVAGIDLGIKKRMAISCSNGSEKLIGNNRQFKQFQYYTKLIAEAQSELPQGRYTSRRLSKIYSMRNKWQSNLLNNFVRSIARFMRKNDVSSCYSGDLTGIREDADWGRKGNTMLHNFWAYDICTKKLANICEESGIYHEAIDESYTSQTCPICGIASENNKKDRIFLCGFCGYIDHRDIVGSTNIMLRGMQSRESLHQGETALLRGGCHAATA